MPEVLEERHEQGVLRGRQLDPASCDDQHTMRIIALHHQAVQVVPDRLRLLLATVALVVMAITHGLRWKVSLHLGGIAGSVTVFVLLVGPVLLVLSTLVAPVGWARWRVGAHTVAQAVVATILAVVITVGTFWVMRIPVAFPR